MLIGDAVGLLLMLLQKYFGWVRLNPETYYLDVVPVELNIGWIVGINVASLIVTMLALVLPGFLVSRVQPAKDIQFD